MTNTHEYVRKALAALTEALRPFVERELQAVHGDRWIEVARQNLPGRRVQGKLDVIDWDALALLTVVWEEWQRVFRHKLRRHQRSLVNELKHFRNHWAHQGEFDFDDTYRLLDGVQRLMEAIGYEDVDRMRQQKNQLLRERFEHEFPRPPGPSELSVVEGPVFVTCGAALGFQIVESFGSRAWPIALLAGVSFAYILFRRLREERRTRRNGSTASTGNGAPLVCPQCEGPVSIDDAPDPLGATEVSDPVGSSPDARQVG